VGVCSLLLLEIALDFTIDELERERHTVVDVDPARTYRPILRSGTSINEPITLCCSAKDDHCRK
jgi:hypothetical protein